MWLAVIALDSGPSRTWNIKFQGLNVLEAWERRHSSLLLRKKHVLWGLDGTGRDTQTLSELLCLVPKA